MDCYDFDGNEVDETGYIAGVERAKLEVLKELVRTHERWSGLARGVAEAQLDIIKLNIENLLY